MAASLLLAIALMLIIEGMFPFVFPNSWRDTFRRIALAMVLGVILLIIAT